MEIIDGSAATIKARHSEVILHIPKGVYGIILGNVYTALSQLKHLVGPNDTIIGPICVFELHRYKDIPKGAWYKIQVPHIVKNIAEARDKIKFKYQDQHQESIRYAKCLLSGEDPPIDSVNVYYRLCCNHVEIFTMHFSQFIIYAENTPIEELITIPEPINCCTRSGELLVFALELDPAIQLSVYLCSSHYPDRDYRQVVYSITNYAVFPILTFPSASHTGQFNYMTSERLFFFFLRVFRIF